MKKTLVNLFVVGIALFILVSTSRADYVYTDTVSTGSGYGTIGYVSSDQNDREITWTHSMDGFSLCGQITDITLEIRADDVDTITWSDGTRYGEFDNVYMSQNEQDWTYIGQLEQDGLATVDEGYVSGTGHHNNSDFLSTSIFDLSPYGLNLGSPLYLKVIVQASADVEIEKSILTVRCAPVPIPGAVWLFGSGVLCLIGMSRKLANKKRT